MSFLAGKHLLVDCTFQFFLRSDCNLVSFHILKSQGILFLCIHLITELYLAMIEEFFIGQVIEVESDPPEVRGIVIVELENKLVPASLCTLGLELVGGRHHF